MRTRPNQVLVGDRSAVASPTVTPVFNQNSFRSGVAPKPMPLRGAGVMSAGVDSVTPAPYHTKKVTGEVQVKIRLLYASGITQVILAKTFGISQSLISKITRGVLRSC